MRFNLIAFLNGFIDQENVNTDHPLKVSHNLLALKRTFVYLPWTIQDAQWWSFSNDVNDRKVNYLKGLKTSIVVYRQMGNQFIANEQFVSHHKKKLVSFLHLR